MMHAIKFIQFEFFFLHCVTVHNHWTAFVNYISNFAIHRSLYANIKYQSRKRERVSPTYVYISKIAILFQMTAAIVWYCLTARAALSIQLLWRMAAVSSKDIRIRWPDIALRVVLAKQTTIGKHSTFARVFTRVCNRSITAMLWFKISHFVTVYTITRRLRTSEAKASDRSSRWHVLAFAPPYPNNRKRQDHLLAGADHEDR